MSTNRTSPIASIISVTPGMAARLLESNAKNRTVNARTVSTYAQDMRRGAWRLTGEALKFTTDGVLLDGQHRLHAVVESGATVEMLAIHGIEPEAQAVMDSGRKRTAADALTLAGERNANILAAIARLACQFDFTTRTLNTGVTPSHSEIQEFIQAFPDLRDSAAAASRWSGGVDMEPRVLGFTHWWFSQIDQDAANQFWQAMYDGAGLPAGSPILALRNRLAHARRIHARTKAVDVISMTTRAWNAWRAGATISHLKVTRNHGESIPVPMPV